VLTQWGATLVIKLRERERERKNTPEQSVKVQRLSVGAVCWL
jgi:hypothetical protein